MSGFESLIIPALATGASVVAASAMAPKPPKPEPVKPMPDENAPAVLEARRRKVAERQSAGGRESTILSDDTYSNSLLGQ